MPAVSHDEALVIAQPERCSKKSRTLGILFWKGSEATHIHARNPPALQPSPQTLHLVVGIFLNPFQDSIMTTPNERPQNLKLRPRKTRTNRTELWKTHPS
ncbi:MAG: hypothetical protein QXI50_06200 [Candidatus Caldarchaeum sp.]